MKISSLSGKRIYFNNSNPEIGNLNGGVGVSLPVLLKLKVSSPEIKFKLRQFQRSAYYRNYEQELGAYSVKQIQNGNEYTIGFYNSNQSVAFLDILNQNDKKEEVEIKLESNTRSQSVNVTSVNSWEKAILIDCGGVCFGSGVNIYYNFRSTSSSNQCYSYGRAWRNDNRQYMIGFYGDCKVNLTYSPGILTDSIETKNYSSGVVNFYSVFNNGEWFFAN